MNKLLVIFTALWEFLREFFKYKSTASIRKMEIAIDAGEKYIQVNEKDGEFEKISASRQKKLLKHYRKRFFAHNN